MKLSIYNLSIAWLRSDTWRSRGGVETVLCVTNWNIDVSGAIKADVHIHDLLENRSMWCDFEIDLIKNDNAP